MSTALRPVEDRRLAGIALMVIAYLLFTAIDSCAKWLALAGFPIWQISAVRFAGHALLVLGLFLPTEGLRMAVARRPGLVAVRGLCLLCGTLFNFVAVRHLPLTLTATIFFTMPLMVCALSVPLLGERVGARRWTAIAVGFLGVVVATRPWEAGLHWAVACSFGATLSASFYALLTRRLAGVDSAATQQIYASALPAFVLAPVAAFDWHWPTRAPDWVALSLIGVFGFAGHQLMTRAHRYAPASVLAPFVYTQLAFMTASSWLVFGQAPDRWMIAGGVIVLASGLYVWNRERRLAAR